MLSSENKIFEETGLAIAKQIAVEVELLEHFYPDKDLKESFEKASLFFYKNIWTSNLF